MKKPLGRPVYDREELGDLFEPDEGAVNLYYGRIGSGKTYSATADILEALEHGQVVYCNWHINYDAYDERESFWASFWKLAFFQKLYFKFPKENLHYFNIDNDVPCPACGEVHQVDIKFLSNLTDCQIFADEGQWIFDSRSRLDQAWRKLILHTRHMNRTLNIVSQRTQAIEVSARGQVNRFYKCEKKLTWPWLIFRRYEFQEMKENDVNEDPELMVSVKTYFARKKVMQAYDTKYLRAGMKRSQRIYYEVFKLDLFERTLAIWRNIFSRSSPTPPDDLKEISKRLKIEAQ